MLTTMEQIRLRNNIHYEQPMIDSDHRHSLWYGGDVLSIDYKGYTLTLRANGEVRGWYQKSQDEPLIEIRDSSCHGDFYGIFQNIIPSDAILMSLLLPGDKQTILNMEDTNWWEVFISQGDDEITSVPLDSETYDEAITELVQHADQFIDQDNTTYHSPVYVYHEYQDDQAYGSQLLRVFHDQEYGRRFLRRRVETVMRCSWDELKAQIQDDDTMESDYVSILTGDACQFFILDTCVVY